MKSKFKVWVTIERIDNPGTAEEEYEDVSAFPVCAGEFETIEEADKFIVELTGDSSL